MNVLMVCLGNICRSPLAEGILKNKINREIEAGKTQFKTWRVESAGTSAFHAGSLPDERSIAVARKNNIDITDQRSRPFRTSDLEEFDLIYAMDSSNYTDIISKATNEHEKNKVKLIMNEPYPDKNIAVPDPYYGEYGFDNVFAMLNEACEAIIKPHL